jgi:hypothetical protein
VNLNFRFVNLNGEVREPQLRFMNLNGQVHGPHG